MALTREFLRIAKLDGEIVELHYLYEREVMREKELGRRFCLASKALRYRLDNTIKVRDALMRKAKERKTITMTYSRGLEYKVNELADAEYEYEQLQKNIVIAGSNALTMPCAENTEELLRLNKELGVQKGRIGSKRRALENYKTKRGKVTAREPIARLPRGYRPAEDVDEFIKGNDILDPMNDFELRIAPDRTIAEKLQSSGLAKSSNWAVNENKPEFDSKMALELLSQAPSSIGADTNSTASNTIDVTDAPDYDERVFEKTTPMVKINEL